MRQIPHGSWSHYANYVSMKINLADAEAQLATLRALGDAIKQERRNLERVESELEPVMAAAR